MPENIGSDQYVQHLPKLGLWRLPQSLRNALSMAFPDWTVVTLNPLQTDTVFEELNFCDVYCFLEDNRQDFLGQVPKLSIVLLNSKEDERLADQEFCLPLPFTIKQFARLLAAFKPHLGGVGEGDLHGVFLDIAERTLIREGFAESAYLTDREFALVKFLLGLGQEGADKSIILQKVWGFSEMVETQTLETHISRIRHKLMPLKIQLGICDGRYSLKRL